MGRAGYDHELRSAQASQPCVLTHRLCGSGWKDLQQEFDYWRGDLHEEELSRSENCSRRAVHHFERVKLPFLGGPKQRQAAGRGLGWLGQRSCPRRNVTWYCRPALEDWERGVTPSLLSALPGAVFTGRAGDAAVREKHPLTASHAA